MDQHDKRRPREDATLTLGAEVIARLDGYRRELEQRTPGVAVSRSAAVRAILLQALPGAQGRG